MRRSVATDHLQSFDQEFQRSAEPTRLVAQVQSDEELRAVELAPGVSVGAEQETGIQPEPVLSPDTIDPGGDVTVRVAPQSLRQPHEGRIPDVGRCDGDTTSP